MLTLYTRLQIQTLLLVHRCKATVKEFFNEEDGEEEIHEILMTQESLAARLKSLGVKVYRY